MASNYTEHYDLCQWEATDQVQRTDFNADNAKVDAALNTLAGQVAEKADGDDLAALSETVAGHTTALAGCGNCQIYTTSYTGTGAYGEDRKNSLTFSSVPWLVVIASCSDGTIMTALNGQPTSWARASGAAWNNLAWSGNTLSWYSTSADSQLNERGEVYQVAALLKAE